MRHYPSISDEFQYGSVPNVNLLDSVNPSNIIEAGTLNGAHTAACANSQIQNFHDEDGNGETINFHNTMACNSNERNRTSLDVGRWDTAKTSSIDGYDTSPIGDRMTLTKYSQGQGNVFGSDLNSSMNSFNDSSPLPQRKRPERNGYLLWVVTPVAASISVAIVVAALAGPQWLFTEERVPNNSYTGIPIFDLENDDAFVTKYTKSSLWILCYTFQGMKSYNCVKVDCFPEEQYRPDPQDSTLAIPYTIVKSAPFFFVSGVFLLISFLVFLLAACTNQNSLYYFTSGILFIVSGLLMLIGLIAYISIFKAEIGSKLRPRSTLQPPPLKFSYGHSFFLYVFGFVTTEFVGVLNIFLFISLQQIGHHKTIPCLPFMNTQEKIKDVEATNFGRRQFLDADDEGTPRFTCKRHPIAANSLYSNDFGKRFYFDKSLKCDIHSRDITKSLNELHTDPTPSFRFNELPHEFPLTRSVSTTTDIYSSNINSSDQTNDVMNMKKNNRWNQTNNSDENLKDICGLSRGILAKGRKSKDELFNEFCKKAGMRPKPKDIYYIEDSCDQEEENIFVVDNYSSLTKNRRSSYVEPQQRNSNSSFRPLNKTYPKSLFDLDRCETEAWNNCQDQYYQRDKSRDDYLSQSRTLPRCFMQRNFCTNDLGVQRYSYDITPKIHKDVIDSNGMFYKSHDDMNALNVTQRRMSKNLTVQWPVAIPTSPSSFSTKSNFRTNSDMVQYNPVHKFVPNYGYNVRKPHIFDSFDLDQIEKERRKSHANLFELGYDMDNGTAV